MIMNTASQASDPINDMVEASTKSTSSSNHKSFSLDQQQIDEFFAVGHIIVKQLFDRSEIERITSNIDQLIDAAQVLFATHHDFSEPIMHHGTQFVLNKTDQVNQVKRIVWAGAMRPELLTIARQQKLLEPVAQLLNYHEADQLINQVHLKMPGDQVTFPWHQDCQNRRKFDENWHDVNGKGSFVQTITAIDTMNEDNGTIYFVPDSVAQGDIHLDEIDDEKALEQRIGAKRMPLILQPGDVVFMHPYLIHGSGPNTSTRSRRIFINGFSYPGANHEPYPGNGSACRISLQNF